MTPEVPPAPGDDERLRQCSRRSIHAPAAGGDGNTPQARVPAQWQRRHAAAELASAGAGGGNAAGHSRLTGRLARAALVLLRLSAALAWVNRGDPLLEELSRPAAPARTVHVFAGATRATTHLSLLRSPRVLFWIPTLIWASTWHVILYQLASGVPPIVSVAWRFLFASLLLFAVAIARGEGWRLAPRRHAMLVATGIIQYAVNYWCVYEAERHIPSGLVAVLFSLMVFGNALLGWWAFGQTVSRRFLLAAAGGVVGVVLIFWPEVVSTGARPNAALGLAIGVGAVACACIGNVMTLKLSRRGVPLVPMLAWSMGYAALSLYAVATLQGLPLASGSGTAWWLSLAYLSVFGSVTAFLLYFRFAQQLGAARAAMTGVMIPPIALTVSAALEGWRPDALSLAGIALCVGGVYVATRPAGSTGA